jgi:hypothetical protein
MCGFPSRGCTHVEPPLSWSCPAQVGDQHGALVLYLKETLLIARQHIQAVCTLHNEALRDDPRWGDVLETFVLETLR